MPSSQEKRYFRRDLVRFWYGRTVSKTMAGFGRSCRVFGVVGRLRQSSKWRCNSRPYGSFFPKTPSSCSALRTSTNSGSFIASKAIVTRATRVRPVSRGPSHLKCADHTSRRGWNRRTISLVSGSTPATFGPLKRLQWMHDNARFSSSVLPPCCRAMM